MEGVPHRESVPRATRRTRTVTTWHPRCELLIVLRPDRPITRDQADQAPTGLPLSPRRGGSGRTPRQTSRQDAPGQDLTNRTGLDGGGKTSSRFPLLTALPVALLMKLDTLTAVDELCERQLQIALSKPQAPALTWSAHRQRFQSRGHCAKKTLAFGSASVKSNGLKISGKR